MRPRNIDLFHLRCLLAETVHGRSYSVQAPSGAVGSGTALEAGRSRVRFALMSLDFLLTSGSTVAVGSIQPLTERSTFWG